MRTGFRINLCRALSAAVLIAGADSSFGQDLPTKGDCTSTRQAGTPVPATKDNARNAEMAAARPAVEKGLKFLATRQQEDGAFSNSGYGRNAAVVALAGMAWLAGGSTPGRGPYGEEVAKVCEYLLEHCEQSGFISVEGAQSHGPMYEHGFATLFLAEVYGMSPRDDLRDKLRGRWTSSCERRTWRVDGGISRGGRRRIFR